MNADDYQNIKEIFQSVLEAPVDKRQELLDQRCGPNAYVRDEVERLLNSYESGFLEQPAGGHLRVSFAEHDLPAGGTVGHYTIISKIGSGGMGEVYLAEDGKLGRRVAIKLLPESFTEDEERLRRFEQEARTASALNHPNILTVFEIGETGSTRYIATEYIDGETLRARLNRGRLPVAEALEIAIQCASALAAAHENGIIHRDIKPENIMLRQDSLVKVLDFGLAKLSSAAAQPGGPEISHEAPTERHVLTAPGVIMGTVLYMSPEQTRGHATDARTDIWSLGVVHYEMVAGAPPFEGDTSADLIAEIVKSHPQLPSRLASEVPERLDEIISKSIEKNADERYQTAKDLLIDLKRLRRNLELEDVLERSNLNLRTEPIPAVISGPNVISTKKGPKDLTTVNSVEYLYWGILAHRWTAIGMTLFVLSLVGGTALLVRYYWSEEDPNERRFAYSNKIKLASQALEASNLDYAKQLLDELKPQKGQEDLRSFEWGYLARLHSERETSQPMTIEGAGAQGVSFSQDGRSIATAGFDGTVRIWDAATGEEKKPTRSGHNGWVWSVAFSSSENIMLTGGADKTVRMWAANGQEMFVLGGEADPVQTPVFAPDGKSFAAIKGDRIRFWDAAYGAEFRAIGTHGADMLFAYSPNGKYLCVRGPDFTTLVVDREKDRIVSTLKGHSGFQTDAEFSPDSQQVLTGNTDGTAKLWDVKTGRDLRTFRGHPGDIYEVAISPDGKIVAAVGKHDSITLWDRDTGYEFAILKGHTGNVDAIAFSPDSRKLVSGSDDNTTRVWNVPTNETRGVLRGHTADVKSIAFSRDSKQLASASNRSAKIWDVATEQHKQSIPGPPENFNSVDFSPDGRTLLTGGQDQQVTLWDAVTGRALRKFDSLSKGTAAYFSQNGQTIATTHFFDNLDVRLWDAVSGKQKCSFRTDENDKESAWDVTFGKDGRTITASGLNNIIGLWDASTCAEIWKYVGPADQILIARFSIEDKLIGIDVLNNARSLRLFDPRTGVEIASIRGHDTEMKAVELSPDGKRLVTASEDGSIIIWDVVTGQEVLSLKTGPSGDIPIAFSPDGKILAAAGKDSTVRLWRSIDLNE